ncbi:hypothetical protein GJAV_G00254470 [Gymnothorax javanicus]|nr:hypothetical protein GJAV_G00254470 [Gymnothorax javanicus]
MPFKYKLQVIRELGNGCRYVARKISAAIRGEEQPQKPVKSECSISKAWKGEGSARKRSALEPEFDKAPQSPSADRSLAECGS